MHLASLPQKYRYKVDGCVLWSTGSWDVLAVYPESTTSEGSYFDPVVAQIIDRHNSAAREAGHAYIAPTRDRKSGVRKFKSGIGVPLRRVGPPDTAAFGDGLASTASDSGAGAAEEPDSIAAEEQESSESLGIQPSTTLYSSSGSSLLKRRASAGAN